ncbi:hypothetical protein [Catenulispora rubra]|uniref:hypothetical protein n=1 Tax=Catenulispora rubra TaxID=280293 RepID=UPI00189278B4|nr:hypothetical protein [Catenulispora rubra]
MAVAVAGLLWWPHHDAASGPTKSAASTDVLGRLAPTGNVHLVAFLATQPDTAATPSRSQAVEITSLLTQYGAKGLTAEIVDESGATASALTNTYYDWQLGNIRLTGDPGRVRASQYQVTNAPTTLLIDDKGTVLARWDSYVLTAQAAQIIAGKLA